MPFEANSRSSTSSTGRESNEKGPSRHPKGAADSMPYTLLVHPMQNIPDHGPTLGSRGRRTAEDPVVVELGDSAFVPLEPDPEIHETEELRVARSHGVSERPPGVAAQMSGCYGAISGSEPA